MTDTITIGATIITPTVVLGFESARPGGTLTHPILGRSNPDVTLRPAGMRAGTLQLGFAGASSEADSLAAETAHASGVVAVFASTDRATVGMSYVVPASGRITRTLEDTTRNAWVVSVDFEEVAP